METTNFFNQIAQLNFTGDLQLNIAKGAENNLVVLVKLNNEHCGDNAKNFIPPLTLRATAQEFDEGFFDKITAPIETVSGLMVDMEKFLKQVEVAKRQSAMEKEKTEKERKEKEAKDKKYKDAMVKVDELEKEGKFREAWMKVPQPTEYPEKAEEIRKRKSDLSSKFAPDLFGTAVQEQQPEPPKEGLYPEYNSDEAEEEMRLEDEEETEY